MSLRKQRLCDCCGCWTQSKTFCAQCLHAGCDKKKKGDRCYLSQGSMHQRSHTMTVEEAIASSVVTAAGKAVGKVTKGLRETVGNAVREAQETNL